RLLPFAGEVIQYRSGCPSCMACGGVVDGDMQAEVMGIDTQLGELVGADQQVQGKLLVAEIEADDFRQEFAGKLPQRQLQRALKETIVRQVGQMRGGQLQLAAQEVPRLAEVVRGRVQQTLVQRADVGLIGLVLGQCLHGRILCGGYLFRAARRGKIQGKSEVAGDRG